MGASYGWWVGLHYGLPLWQAATRRVGSRAASPSTSGYHAFCAGGVRPRIRNLLATVTFIPWVGGRAGRRAGGRAGWRAGEGGGCQAPWTTLYTR